MAVKPISQNQEIKNQMRGDGKIESFGYLKQTDPISYYYHKLKTQKNKYLRDDMWSEASLRGESAGLLGTMLEVSKPEVYNQENQWYDMFTQFDGYNDYDGYMLAMRIPTLDNEKKEEKTVDLEDGTKHSFGQFTEQEWAISLFKEKLYEYEAKKVQQEKENMNFWEKTGAEIGNFFITVGTGLVSGFLDFFQDIYNLVEGLNNLCFDWSRPAGERWLSAFANDSGDPLAQVSTFLKNSSYDFSRRFSLTVNAVTAYKEGYRYVDNGNYWDQTQTMQNAGAGMNWWGKTVAGISQSVGYMLPSIMLNVATAGGASGLQAISSGASMLSKVGKVAKVGKLVGGALKSGMFYTGIFSGNIKSEVETYALNGISYKDLNALDVTTRSAFKAVAQYGIEIALGKLIGSTALDVATGVAKQGSGLLGKALSKTQKSVQRATSIGSKFTSAVGKVAAHGLKEATQEGAEEFLQDLSDGLIDFTFGTTNNDELLKKIGLEKMSISNLVDSFVLGAMTSVVMGNVRNAKFVLPKNRIYTTNDNGEAVKLGMFQSINFSNSIKLMQEWANKADDIKLSLEERADAAFKVQVAYDNITSVAKGMGSERFMEATKLLLAKETSDEKRKELLEKTDILYSTKLVEDLFRNNSLLATKYKLKKLSDKQEKLKEKIKKAAEKKAEKLKKNNVTEFTDVITSDEIITADQIDTQIETNNTDGKKRIQSALEKIGEYAIVGTNGRIITKSDNIVFVGNEILLNGDVEAIVRGVAYESVYESVLKALSKSQQNMILKAYRNITRGTGDLETAITAFLFDKNFYTHILLQAGEKRSGNLEALQLLATVDKVAKKALFENVNNGTVEHKAAQTLMNKILDTMRAGLVNFATTHQYLNIDEISDEVLDPDLKKELRNNSNLRYTYFVNSHKDGKDLSDQEKVVLNYALQNMGVDIKLRDELFNAAVSKDPNRRSDAFWTLSLLANLMNTNKNSGDVGKVAYLPLDQKGKEQKAILDHIYTFTGNSLKKLLDGSMNKSVFPREFQDFLGQAYGMSPDGKVNFDWSNPEARLSLVERLVYEGSAGKYTITTNGIFLQAFTREDLLKDPKLSDKNFIKRVKHGKATVKDLFKVDIPYLANTKLEYLPNRPDISAQYSSKNDTIYITDTSTVSSLLHEITHVAQSLLGLSDTLKSEYQTQGGSRELFEVLNKESRVGIENWLKENRPLYYKTLSAMKEDLSSMIYISLDGEMKAMASLNTINYTSGFLFNDSKTMLYSPDRKSHWSLETEVERKAREYAEKKNGAIAQPVVETPKIPKPEQSTTPKVPKPMSFKEKKQQAREDQKLQNRKNRRQENNDLRKKLKEDPNITSLYQERNNDSDKLKYLENVDQSLLEDGDQAALEWLKKNDSKPVEKKEPVKQAESTEPSMNFIQRTRKRNNKNEEKKKSKKPGVSRGTKPNKVDSPKSLEDFNKILQEKAKTGNRIKVTDHLIVNENSGLKFYKNRQVTVDFARFLGNVNYKRLNPDLRNQIESGELTHNKVINWLGNHNNIDDYTFKQIAKYFYGNDYVAEMTYDDMVAMLSELNLFRKSGYLTKQTDRENGTKEYEKRRQYDDMKKQVASYLTNQDAFLKKSGNYTDEQIKKMSQKEKNSAFMKVMEAVSTKTNDKKTNKADEFAEGKDINLDAVVSSMNTVFFKLYDGSLKSIVALYNYARSIYEHNYKTAESIYDEAITETLASDRVSGELNKKLFVAHIDADIYNGNVSPDVYKLAHMNIPKPNSSTYDKLMFIDTVVRESEVSKWKNMSEEERSKKIVEEYNKGVDKNVDDGITVKMYNSLDQNDKVAIFNQAMNFFIDRTIPDNPTEAQVNKAYKRVLEIGKKIKAKAIAETKKTTEEFNEKTKIFREINAQRKKTFMTSTSVARRIAKNAYGKKDFNKIPEKIRKYYQFHYGSGKVELVTAKSKPVQTSRDISGEQIPGSFGRGFSVHNTSIEELKKKKQEILEFDRIANEFWTSEKELAKRVKQLEARLKETKDGSQEQLDVLHQADTDIKNYYKEHELPLKEDEYSDVPGVKHKRVTNIGGKTLDNRIEVKYEDEYDGVEIKFRGPEANKFVSQLLSTSFTKSKQSQVKGLDENSEFKIVKFDEWLAHNADILVSTETEFIEQALKWFETAQAYGGTTNEHKQYEAIKTYFFGWVLSQRENGQRYQDVDRNLLNCIERIYEGLVSNAGTVLAAQRTIIQKFNPKERFKQSEIKFADVELTKELKDSLYTAIESGDVAAMQEEKQKIYEYINKAPQKRKTWKEKLLAIRSAFLLSSPITWLRNIISNVMLKRIYKMSDKIGKMFLPSKTVDGQLRFDKPVTEDITKFINENFVDNNLFDAILSNISKYDPSQLTNKIAKKTEGTEMPTKAEIMSELVLKSMYSEYYNNKMFEKDLTKKVHEKLMSFMSDSKAVRKATIDTFGKILAERNYDLSKGVTDQIMNDFATSFGMGLQDYMHSSNWISDLEANLSKKHPNLHVVFKLILPFASSAWNWFGAMIKLSPIGLVRSVVKLCKLERSAAKQQENFEKGRSQFAGEFTEQMLRRQVGMGIIGTTAMILGLIMAALGVVKLEDDDYGVPKIQIGGISVDVSTLFGSSSFLAGAAFVATLRNGDDLMKALNNMGDVILNELPLMDLIQLDMYATGSFSMIGRTAENILYSFLFPNVLTWISGFTYDGDRMKRNFFERAMAKIPFLGLALVKKVDPYTGKETGTQEWFSRVIPFFSFHFASLNESKTTALGLNKTMLNGKYTINGENFKVDGKDLVQLNKTYGQLNSKDLSSFYNDGLSVRILVNGQYRTLRCSQMTDEQRKTAVQSIMSSNAELVKIIAWTNAGHKYYASSTTYSKLVQIGHLKNVFSGSLGFVK